MSPVDPNLAFIPVTSVDVLTCPQGIVYLGAGDGCAGAPAGTPQYPNLLNGYVTRPPWNVAGVDYHVGIPAGTVLTDWVNISDPNISISTGMVRCLGRGASVTLNAIDFSLHGGAYVYNGSGGCSKLTITNSNFACPRTATAFAMVIDQNNAELIINQNKFDQHNCGGSISSLIAGGNTTLQYNWFINGQQHVFETGANAGTSIDVDYRYNLLDNMEIYPGNHQNYLQWGGIGSGTGGSTQVKFNTSYQTSAGAEGYQFAPYPNGVLNNTAVQYNTMIAKLNSRSPAMSYMMHGNCHSTGDCSTTTGVLSGTADISNNYFDTSGAYGAFYPSSFTIPGNSWTYSGNTDMNTGSAITPR